MCLLLLLQVLVPFSGGPWLHKSCEELAADIASYQSADGQVRAACTDLDQILQHVLCASPLGLLRGHCDPSATPYLLMVQLHLCPR